jgi:GDP-L-fucose synthase
MSESWLAPEPFPNDVVSALSNRSVLITGAHGFLGRYVAAAIGATGAEVLAPRRDTLDLVDQESTFAYFESVRPDMVIHLAAECGGIGANVENPGRYLYANAMMGLLLLEASRRACVSKVAVISTTCAYPRNAPLPLQESSIWDGPPTGATGPYGMAKRLLHEAVAGYNKQYGCSGVVLVPANLYGPGDHFETERSHVVPAMIRRYVDAESAQQSEVVNWGTGTPTREFLHARDAAAAITLALSRHNDPSPVNLGTGIETSIRDLATTIAEHVGYTGNLQWDRTKPDGQPRRYLNVEAAKAFGFNAQIKLSDGLSETIDWFRENPVSN